VGERCGELIDAATIPAEAGLSSLKRLTIGKKRFPTVSNSGDDSHAVNPLYFGGLFSVNALDFCPQAAQFKVEIFVTALNVFDAEGL
jgi:hypothetical protein